MNVPPRQERMPGGTPLRRLCTVKARTSSSVLKLATKLGDMSWRDLVRVVKANNPDIASPTIGYFFRLTFLSVYLPKKIPQS